jgi:hypothetical protein
MKKTEMSESRKMRKQTPRVPSNFLYTKLVPIAIGVMVIVLLSIMVLVLAPLLGLGRY